MSRKAIIANEEARLAKEASMEARLEMEAGISPKKERADATRQAKNEALKVAQAAAEMAEETLVKERIAKKRAKMASFPCLEVLEEERGMRP